MIQPRPFHALDDYPRLYNLLLANHTALGAINWPLVRLDSYRYGAHWRDELARAYAWADGWRLWAEGDRLLAVAHDDGPGNGVLAVDASARALEPALIAWLEERHAAAQQAAAQPLAFMAWTDDTVRQATLRTRGYVNRGPAEVSRGQALVHGLPPPSLPPGFTLRRVDRTNPADCAALAAATNAVFPHARLGAQAMALHAQTPTCNEDWVALAADGRIAAFCGVWYVAALRLGHFEPVGTLEQFRRLGLGRAVMTAGLRQLAALGADQAWVDTGYGMDANQLYAALGFHTVRVYERWERG